MKSMDAFKIFLTDKPYWDPNNLLEYHFGIVDKARALYEPQFNTQRRKETLFLKLIYERECLSFVKRSSQ